MCRTERSELTDTTTTTTNNNNNYYYYYNQVRPRVVYKAAKTASVIG